MTYNNLTINNDIDFSKFSDTVQLNAYLDDAIQIVENIVSAYPDIQFQLDIDDGYEDKFSRAHICFRLSAPKYEFISVAKDYTADFVYAYLDKDEYGYYLSQQSIDSSLRKISSSYIYVAKQLKNADVWMNKKLNGDLRDIPYAVQRSMYSFNSYLNKQAKLCSTIDELIDNIYIDYIDNKKLQRDNPGYYKNCVRWWTPILEWLPNSNMTVQDIAKLARTARKRVEIERNNTLWD